MPSVKLKKGRDKSFNRKHPWIFSGAIDSVKDINQNGETVDIISGDGKLLGYGSYSSQSQISVRVLSFNAEDKIDSYSLSKELKVQYNFASKLLILNLQTVIESLMLRVISCPDLLLINMAMF